jgi:hypothetical protein
VPTPADPTPDDHDERTPVHIEHSPKTSKFRIRLTPELGIRLAIGVGLIVLSLYMNRSFLVWGLIALLAVIFVPTGRARSFVAAIVPYATVWFVFTFLRSLADETILAKTLNTRVAEFERWLFGGELPTIRLQAAFYEPGNIQWWDYYFTFIHWSYFIIPHAVIGFLWWKHKRAFQHYLAALTMLLTLGLLVYFIIPSNPPWMAPESIDSPGAPVVLRIMEPIAKELGGGLYQAGYKIVGESNPIAAMPSIHFAVTFLLVWAARGRGKQWEAAAWLYAFSMGAALVYMGEHYIVDIIVGGLVTSYSWFATGNWLNRNRYVLSPTHFGPPTEEAEPVSPEEAEAAPRQGSNQPQPA